MADLRDDREETTGSAARWHEALAFGGRTVDSSPEPPMQNQPILDLKDDLSPARAALLAHPIHAAVDSLPRLRAFMPIHVFAVWDFMALVKRLQRELTCVTAPWLPPKDAELARFINEIVRDEESDVDPDGKACSHFELYRRAMREIGADDGNVMAFLAALEHGTAVPDALAAANVAEPIREFVQSTLTIAERGSPLEVAACFLFGRENLIPAMFRAFLDTAPGDDLARCFRHYLERHIDLDGDHHSVLAARLVDAFWHEADENERDAAIASARGAITARARLWDYAVERIRATDPTTNESRDPIARPATPTPARTPTKPKTPLDVDPAQV